MKTTALFAACAALTCGLAQAAGITIYGQPGFSGYGQPGFSGRIG